MSNQNVHVPEAIPEQAYFPSFHSGNHLDSKQISLIDLPLASISPNPFQPRKNFDPHALEDLANSIRTHGLITRIRVRPDPARPEQYQLVYGERRWRAAQLLELATIPAEVGNYTDDELTEIGLIENIQRQALSPLEEAVSFRHLLDHSRYSIRTLARQLGKNKNYVEERLALLELPQDIQTLLETNPKTSLRALIETAKLPTSEARAPLIKQLQLGMLSTEEVRMVVREVMEAVKTSKKTTPELSTAHITEEVLFLRQFHYTTRRAQAVLDNFEELVHLYETAPDQRKKEKALESITILIEAAQHIKERLL